MRTVQMGLLAVDDLLLPQGRIEVAIAEPCYLRMVSEALKGHYPLAFGMLKPKASPPCYPIATECKIIDFNQLEDGCLTIVLEGLQRVKILSAGQQQDGLWQVRTLAKPNWQEEPIAAEFELISVALAQFYQVNPAIKELYGTLYLNDATWVSQRWLEVLPLYNHDKQKLLSQPDCHKTMDFVLSLIKSHA